MKQLEECTKVTANKKIVISENGRAATFSNEHQADFRIIRFDGCLVRNAMAADWIICSLPGDLILELKGVDVDHAVTQILATLQFWRKHPSSAPTLAAMIVSRRYPKTDTKVQRAKGKLVKEKMKLTVASRNQTYDFGKLFA